MKLDSNAHSVFMMYYHLVLVVKYHRKVFDDETSDRAKERFKYIAPKYNIALQGWNHDKDHVHILFKAIHKRLQKCKQQASEKRTPKRYGKSYGRNVFGVKVSACLQPAVRLLK